MLHDAPSKYNSVNIAVEVSMRVLVGELNDSDFSAGLMPGYLL